jgi:cytochrome P450
LAYSEIRLILAKVLYRFDFSLVPESVGWEKKKLMVTLKLRAEVA